MNLHLGLTTSGKAFSLPLELTTQSVAILAKRGSGKSYTGDVIVEELLDAGQVPVIIDPTGAHWGLKSSADGKKAAYPVVVFGGDHADLPLDEYQGAMIARTIVERRFPSIIDLSLLKKGEARRFMIAFLETLYLLNRLPLTLVVDEADDICPQKMFGDEARLVGAMEDVVKRGRKKGLGCILITQRPADLAKQVLTQCEMLVAMRLVHPLDIKAVMEWVHVHGDPATAKRMLDSLPALPVGTAWFWSPGFGDIFECVKIRARKTFDSGATPKPGETAIQPTRLAAIDITRLGKEIEAAAIRAKENDPAELKRRIAELLKRAPVTIESPIREIIKTVEVPLMTAAQIRSLDATSEYLQKITGEIADVSILFYGLKDELLGRLKSLEAAAYHPPQPIKSRPTYPTPPASKIPPMTVLSQEAGDLTEPQVKILDVVAMLEIREIPRSRDSVARWLDLHPKGGNYGANLGRLRSGGYLDNWTMLPPGRAIARAMATGFDEAKRAVTAPQAQILDCLNGSADMTRDSLAAALGLHPKGGNYGANLGRLRTMGLITERGPIRLTEGALK